MVTDSDGYTKEDNALAREFYHLLSGPARKVMTVADIIVLVGLGAEARRRGGCERDAEWSAAATKLLTEVENHCIVDCEGNYEQFEVARDALNALIKEVK